MYQRNNIGFRLVSATHFVSYYKAKAFMLGEILDSDKHKFTPTAREILLQYFSVTTDILMLIEHEFIKRSSGLIDDELKELCSNILHEGLSEMRNRVIEHPSDFDARFSKVWTTVLDATINQLSNRLSTLVQVDIYTSFGSLINYCIGYLNHILYVLHEIDHLLEGGSTPFMYLDKWDLLMKIEEGLCTNEVRLSAYLENKLLNDAIVIKVEIDDEWLGKDPQRIVAYQYAVDLFHRNNIRCTLQRRS